MHESLRAFLKAANDAREVCSMPAQARETPRMDPRSTFQSSNPVSPRRISIAQARRLVAGAIAAGVFFVSCGPTPRGATLSYTVAPLPVAQNALSVTLKYSRFSRAGGRVRFFKGEVDASDLTITDARGRPVDFTEHEGWIGAAPDRGAASLTMRYKATLGKPGRHGRQGGVYPDIVVFDGQHALILPEPALSTSDSVISSHFRDIAISYVVPAQWSLVVPFAEKRAGKRLSLSVVREPNFYTFYQLVKSCYVMGALEKRVLRDRRPELVVAVDPMCRGVYSERTIDAIGALHARYLDIFGAGPDNLCVVLLRPDSATGSHVMGGLGPSAIAATFDPDRARDWELLSHRLFHAFFDSRMPVSLFHKKPQVWLYEGLATYYENVVLDALPEGMRNTLGIDVEKKFAALMRRYVYMRLTNPRLALAPMKETDISSLAQTEFLHYTQAPLVVKFLEDRGCAKFGGRDRILRFLLRNYRDLTHLEPVFSYAVVEDRDEVGRRFLFGSEVLPAWYPAQEREDPAEVIRELDEYAEVLWSWFRLEDPAYPRDTLSASGLPEAAVAARGMDVHFAESDLEKKVEVMSPTVYRLLMARAMRSESGGG